MLVRCHFVAGIGFYRDVLNQLQVEKSKLANGESVDQHDRICYQSLIYIGDLYRYLVDLENRDAWRKGAINSYYEANLINPSTGMPFNQLGTLLSSYNYGLDSVYFYMRW